jgi:hypothetical protein
MSTLTQLRSMSRLAVVASFVMFVPLFGQEYRATIAGTVTDPTGASVPNAQVEVREVDTAAVATAQTNGAGAYTIPFLLPGTYKLTATANGFKQAVRDRIELHAGDKIQADLKLEVGITTETVTVTGESEQLKTGTAAMGQTINADETRDLPGMGRNTYLLATLATGLQSGLYGGTGSGQVSGYGRPYDGAAAQMSVGGLGSQYQIMLNGIPNAPEERGSAAIYMGFVPSPDAVEEVTVQTALYDAQYGHSGGAVINSVLRGGTNQLHGSVYEFFRNDKLNANNTPSNAAGSPRGVMRWNQPGFVVDGPVYLPKIYNGHDKTFFMFSMELIRNASPLPATFSVPTTAERSGDFSALTTSTGAPVVIYDPLTTTLTNGQYIRQPFAGNLIPSTRINPIGKAFINEYPTPNVPGTAGGFSNFVVSPNSQQDKYHSLAGRVDHQINARNRLTMTGFSNQRHQLFPTYGFPDPVASPGYLHYRNNHGGGVDWTDTISPTLVLDIKYGFIFHPFQLAMYGDNYDLTKLGFSQSSVSQLPHENFPAVNMSGGYTGMLNGAVGSSSAASQFSTTFNHSLSGTINKTIGKHNVKAGGELFVMKANNITPVSNVNAISFSAGFTQQNAQNASATAGNPFASMLLGWPSSGGVSYNIASAFQQIYTGFFVQDDWRVTSRLTVNLGLRWEYESPMSERYNRQNDGFALDATNPLQAQVTGLSLKGGLLFTSASNRLPFVRDLNNWGPRIGAAYRLGNHTVLRGGFGTLYSVTFQTGQNNGFSTTTSYVASNDNNLTPANGLSNPFPGGILVPTGSTQGLSTLLGQGFTFGDPNRTIPKVYQYSLALQQQLPKQLLLEVAFAGNYATQLSVSKQINVLPRQYYALPGSPIPVPSTTLLGQVTNPMAGLLPGSSLNSATTAYSNLLVPYPEFGSITENPRSLGHSLYNSMQISVDKRLAAGLQGRLSFTWDKIMQETSYLNNQDDWSQLARAQSSEPTKLITLSLSYNLPIFAHATGLLHNVLGGWQAGGILRYANGYLISAPSGAFSSGVNPKLSNRTYSQWFNTCSLNTSGVRQNCVDANQPVAFIQLPSYTLATLGGVLPGIRSEIPVIVDFSMFKNFQLHEKVKLQFRASAYNLGNTAEYNTPNTSFGAAAFGVVPLSQVNDPRIVELALKLNF